MFNIENAAIQIKDLLTRATGVLIITRSEPSVDAAAASLALAAVSAGMGRPVILVTPSELSERVKVLPGAAKFATSLPASSLVISLEHKPGSIDKVSYQDEGDRFNMVVTPRAGQLVSPDQVSFSALGESYDLVIVVGTPDQALLGSIYESEKDHWSEIPLINIDRHGANTQYGKINIIDHEAASVSEVTARALLASKINITPEVARLLLTGIKDATSSYEQAGPSDFETAGKLSQITSGVKGESTEERLVNEPFRRGEQFKSAPAI